MALNVEGSFDMSGVRYSLARYDDAKGLFDVYAFFNVDRRFNEGVMGRRLGRKLKELFNAGTYICVTESATGKKVDRDFMRLEFYAFCDKPEPSKVCKIKDVVDSCF